MDIRMETTKNKFLAEMAEYYCEKMRDSENFVSRMGERINISVSPKNGSRKLFCSPELAACRMHALPEIERDRLDVIWRNNMAEKWVEFVREWNRVQPDMTIPALMIPISEHIHDEDFAHWYEADTAMSDAEKQIPDIRARFKDWLSTNLKDIASDSLAVKFRFDGEYNGQGEFVARISFCVGWKADPAPDSNAMWEDWKELHTLHIPEKNLMELEGSDIAIRNYAREKCMAMDEKQLEIHNGYKGKDLFFMEFDFDRVNKINRECGYTGPDITMSATASSPSA